MYSKFGSRFEYKRLLGAYYKSLESDSKCVFACLGSCYVCASISLDMMDTTQQQAASSAVLRGRVGVRNLIVSIAVATET